MPISIIELLGAIIGVTFIILEYRASWWLWIAGIIMSLFYMYIFYNENCYAWTLIYLYFLGANIYGVIVWKKNSTASASSGITNLPRKYYPVLALLALLLTLFIYLVISNYTDTRIPVSESFTTALSVIGMWLLAKKYVQHWNIWMVVNPITALGSWWVGLHFIAFTFAVFFVVAAMGLVKWRKLAGK
jgi:nicotinamide mononucleotide transporter